MDSVFTTTMTGTWGEEGLGKSLIVCRLDGERWNGVNAWMIRCGEQLLSLARTAEVFGSVVVNCLLEESLWENGEGR